MDLPIHLYHGVSPKVVARVLRRGLYPEGRRTVRLRTTPAAAYAAGRKKQVIPVLLTIRAQAAQQAGTAFRASRGGVVTDGLAPAWLQHDLVTYVHAGTNLLLSGASGVGKTTVIRRLLKHVPEHTYAGFYTEEIRGVGGQRCGFQLHTLDGQTGMLAAMDAQGFPQGTPRRSARVGRYTVNVDVLDALVNPVIEQAIANDTPLILDEIGKMELASATFRALVRRAIDSPVRLIATVPAYHLPFVDALKRRRDVIVVPVTTANRDAWPAALAHDMAAPNSARHLRCPSP